MGFGRLATNIDYIIKYFGWFRCNLTRSSRRDAGGRTGDGGRRVNSKRLDGGKDRDGGSEAGKEGRSETERTKEEREEGKEEGHEAGRRKGRPAPRTKLKRRGCNSSDLKTISLLIEERV